MVHQKKGTSSSFHGLVGARVPLSGAREDQIPTSFARARTDATVDDVGGVASNHGGIAPYHPMPRGLPLAEGYPPSFAYAALGGWDPTLGGWYMLPYCYSWGGQDMTWEGSRMIPAVFPR